MRSEIDKQQNFKLHTRICLNTLLSCFQKIQTASELDTRRCVVVFSRRIDEKFERVYLITIRYVVLCFYKRVRSIVSMYRIERIDRPIKH